MNDKTRRDDETIDLSATKAGDSTNFSVGEGTGSGGPFDGKEFPIQLGRYELTGLLGRGGMGAVYLAQDQQLERDVALKVPKFSARDNEKAVKRFYREARAAATVTHPNLCPVYDVAEIDGVHCIAMAFIDGKPLSSFIDPSKPPDPKVAATIIRKVALAMEEAHQKKIVHRDLKPANIMIDKRKEPIVMDFGLACQSETSDETRLTQDGTIIGSPAYMSPEQLKGDPKQIGPASDQYSLGIVLYELLCGSLPFENASSTITLLSNILTQEPRPLETMRDGLEPRLVRAVKRAIAKNPSERFSSMKELALELGKYIRDIPLSGGESAAKTSPRVIPSPSPPNSGAPTSSPSPTKATVDENQFDNLPPIPTAGARAFKGSPAGPKYLANQKKRKPALSKGTLALLGLGGLAIAGGGAYFSTLDPDRETATPANPASQDIAAETPRTEDVTVQADDSAASQEETTTSSPVSASRPDPTTASFPLADREERGAPDQPSKQAANQALRRFDRNQDGKIEASELPPPEIARLMEGDSNNDGFLDRAELEAIPDLLGPPGAGLLEGPRIGGPGFGGPGFNGQGFNGQGFGGPRQRGPGQGRPNPRREN